MDTNENILLEALSSYGWSVIKTDELDELRADCEKTKKAFQLAVAETVKAVNERNCLLKINTKIMQDSTFALKEAREAFEALLAYCKHLARGDYPDELNSIRSAATWLKKYPKA